MAKTKKKNANYHNYTQSAAQKKQEPVRESTAARFGLPGWLVAVVFVAMIAALILYQAQPTGWISFFANLLAAIPTLILAVGQNNRRKNSNARNSTMFMMVFGALSVLYIFFAFSQLRVLLGA